VPKIGLPAIIVNFKTYLEATGSRAYKLAKTCEEVAVKTGVTVAVAPQFTDLARVVNELSVPVFSQHVDPVQPGSHTGHVLAEAVKEAGAVGSLLNHSERRLPLKDVGACVGRVKQLGLLAVTCADTPQACKAVAAFSPDIVAIEPPELIGTGIPVSKARPEVVTEAVQVVAEANPGIPVLCGAGISSGDDVRAALKLGTMGVLLASGVVKAKDPSSVLLEMANSMLGS